MLFAVLTNPSNALNSSVEKSLSSKSIIKSKGNESLFSFVHPNRLTKVYRESAEKSVQPEPAIMFENYRYSVYTKREV